MGPATPITASSSPLIGQIIYFFSSPSPQSEFCGDKPKSGAKYGLPESLAILSEMGEVTDGVMDSKVCRFP